VAFLPVEVFVKFCLEAGRKAMHQAFPFNFGLFNISDKLLVSLDILMELREFFKHGVPLTVAIESKLAILSLKAKQVSAQWFCPWFNCIQVIFTLGWPLKSDCVAYQVIQLFQKLVFDKR